MGDTYRIHFSYSKSNRYPQAVEFAQLACKHEVWGEGKDIWHIVTLTETQGNLMASLYTLAKHLSFRGVHITNPENHYESLYHNSDYFGGPRNCKAINERVAHELKRVQSGIDSSNTDLANEIHDRFLLQIWEDMSKVEDKLIRERRIEHFDDETGLIEFPDNPPSEPIEIYRKITDLIERDRYSEAVDAYYESLGDEYYGVLAPELLYLKRLGEIPLSGRDLLYFRPESSRLGLIESNLKEYVDCIEKTLEGLRNVSRQTPLEILLEQAPTLQQLIDERRHDWNDGVYLWNGEFSRDNTPVTVNTFSLDICPEGRLFDRYPDQVRFCRIYGSSDEPLYSGLWTTYSPSDHQQQILDKGLHLNGIEGYQHRDWRPYWTPPRMEPDFSAIQSTDELTKSDYGTRGIEYTGRMHQIGGNKYYEFNTHPVTNETDEYENPFLELVRLILREAENLLRENHGLPRIGEGWVSETAIYQLVKDLFADTHQHASPIWLKPQHLDVFVPTKKLAFEYQGRQHFEPVDFFGGQEAFENTVKRDKLKARKCKRNGVTLILWIYTEPIDQETLLTKLEKAGILNTIDPGSIERIHPRNPSQRRSGWEDRRD